MGNAKTEAGVENDRQSVRVLARPLMQELAEYAQASVALGVQDRLNMLYIEAYRSSATVTLTLDVGSQIPIGLRFYVPCLRLRAIPSLSRYSFVTKLTGPASRQASNRLW